MCIKSANVQKRRLMGWKIKPKEYIPWFNPPEMTALPKKSNLKIYFFISGFTPNSTIFCAGVWKNSSHDANLSATLPQSLPS